MDLILLNRNRRFAFEVNHFCVIYLGGKTPDPQAKGRSYAEIMGEVTLRNAKVWLTHQSRFTMIWILWLFRMKQEINWLRKVKQLKLKVAQARMAMLVQLVRNVDVDGIRRHRLMTMIRKQRKLPMMK
jgi:hypothetical protein